ncbi:unnamed protein product [Closterium sp. Yama58-4]|nr:unnamed protein product [Closterium sp. Yama58-4]
MVDAGMSIPEKNIAALQRFRAEAEEVVRYVVDRRLNDLAADLCILTSQVREYGVAVGRVGEAVKQVAGASAGSDAVARKLQQDIMGMTNQLGGRAVGGASVAILECLKDNMEVPAGKLATIGEHGAEEKYTGVRFCRRKGKWQAGIGLEGQKTKTTLLGNWETEKDAAEAFAAAAVVLCRASRPRGRIIELSTEDRAIIDPMKVSEGEALLLVRAWHKWRSWRSELYPSRQLSGYFERISPPQSAARAGEDTAVSVGVAGQENAVVNAGEGAEHESSEDSDAWAMFEG